MTTLKAVTGCYDDYLGWRNAAVDDAHEEWSDDDDGNDNPQPRALVSDIHDSIKHTALLAKAQQHDAIYSNFHLTMQWPNVLI